MEMYRVMRLLTTEHGPGEIVDGSIFKYLDVLVKVGALARVTSPPLTELPGWTTRAEKLATVGIVTIEDLLNADPQVVKELFNHKRVDTSIKWQAEARSWLEPPPTKKK